MKVLFITLPRHIVLVGSFTFVKVHLPVDYETFSIKKKENMWN